MRLGIILDGFFAHIFRAALSRVEVVGFAIDQQEMGQIFSDFPEEKQRMAQLANLRNQTNKAST